MLTKSLHTITAVTNVAQHLAAQTKYTQGKYLANAALAVLGYHMSIYEMGTNDVTINRCVAACDKIVATQTQRCIVGATKHAIRNVR